MTPTKALGQFVADLSPNRLPDEAVRVARMGFIDTVGTTNAGRNEDSVRILTETPDPAVCPATLTFGSRKAPAPEAAWIDGAAAHALDDDDVALTNRRTLQGQPVARAPGHPSRPLTGQQLYDRFAGCLDAGNSPIPAEVLFARLSPIQPIRARALTAPISSARL